MQKVLFWPDTRSYAWLWIAEVERDAGRLDNALEWLRQGYQQGVFRAEETHWIAGSLATLYARLGIRDRAMEWWQTYDVPGRFSWRLAEESAFSSALQEPERLADAVEFYVASGGRMTLMPRSHIAKFAIRNGDYRRGIELLAPIFEKGWVPRNEPGGSDEMYTTSHYLAVALQRSNQAQQADDLLQRTLELQLAGRDGRSRMLGRRLAEEAVTYLLLGDSATAMARFREAVEAGWRYWYDIGGNPCWDGLREHPEFEALLSQVMDDIALQRERVRAVENVQPFTPDI